MVTLARRTLFENAPAPTVVILESLSVNSVVVGATRRSSVPSVLVRYFPPSLPYLKAVFPSASLKLSTEVFLKAYSPITETSLPIVTSLRALHSLNAPVGITAELIEMLSRDAQ
jgi:hypothetical protein